MVVYRAIRKSKKCHQNTFMGYASLKREQSDWRLTEKIAMCWKRTGYYLLNHTVLNTIFGSYVLSKAN